MLQALLQHKLKESFKNSSFEPSEDSKTSSIFGLLQYLPTQVMWDLLRNSCGNKSELLEVCGELLQIKFWVKWTAKSEDISNSIYVEPDVFYEFENFSLIIEAKKDDQSGQNKKQWENEISAYLNEYPDSVKKIYFIAFGGNTTLEKTQIRVRNKNYDIFFASWQNLLNSIQNLKEESNNHIARLLSDTILAFEKHNFFSLEWLESLPIKQISQTNIINLNSWKFSRINFLNHFYNKKDTNISDKSLNTLSLW